ncbi:hypothetical protein BT69DRAFT_1348562 [Atractiella rhizophila]|nr:hypothetical protein BT69DRAFT_1348562 [Atractiella rhizophila]
MQEQVAVPPYTWHQSHDQATVLFLIPASLSKADIDIRIEQNHVIARTRLKYPSSDGGEESKWVDVIKGRLYRPIDKYNSLWQLEKSTSYRPTSSFTGSGFSTRASSPVHGESSITGSPSSSRSRSSGGSFAVVGNPGSDQGSKDERSLQSSGVFVKASAESLVQVAHATERSTSISASLHSLPTSTSTDASPPASMSQSNYSRPNEALEEKLLTLHLEKLSPEIWQHLIVAPISGGKEGSEDEYDVDVTSMALIGTSKLQTDRLKAFDYLMRAYQQGKSPLATVTLVNTFANLDDISKVRFDMPSPPSPDATVLGLQKPTSSSSAAGHSSTSPTTSTVDNQELLFDRLGGSSAFAQLCVDAGLSVLGAFNHPQSTSASAGLRGPSTTLGIVVRDVRERNWLCGRYFGRAKEIDPNIFIPDQATYGIRDVRWDEPDPVVVGKREEEERAVKRKKEMEKQLRHRAKRRVKKEKEQKEMERWVEVRFYSILVGVIATAGVGMWWWRKYKVKGSD